jgi:hypothetical protein
LSEGESTNETFANESGFCDEFAAAFEIQCFIMLFSPFVSEIKLDTGLKVLYGNIVTNGNMSALVPVFLCRMEKESTRHRQ